MRRTSRVLALAAVTLTGTALVSAASADGFSSVRASRRQFADFLAQVFGHRTGHEPGKPLTVQLGPRPYYLVDDMDEGPLKDELRSCSEDRVRPSDFAFGHRGAPLQFPEHTRESYMAAARTGAGVIECDVTFTKDRQLVCRHAQCDLHTTTNILAIPELAAKCRKPFAPFDAATNTPASAECCTSDITLDEFKSLCGKMDASLPTATTPAEFLGGTASFRTDLYATCGTVLSHQESIALIGSLGAKFTPELKEASVPLPFDGDYTQEKYAQQMIDEYKAAGVSPKNVFAQSFNLADVLYWVNNEPAFGAQAAYLDARVDTPEGYTTAVAGMDELVAQGVKIVAPPSFALLKLDADKQIVPSDYAVAAKTAGLDIITWSLERSGPLRAGGGYYYSSVDEVINNDGDQYTVIDALARQVGVRAIFSDWPATVAYYAGCVHPLATEQ